MSHMRDHRACDTSTDARSSKVPQQSALENFQSRFIADCGYWGRSSVLKKSGGSRLEPGEPWIGFGPT